VGTGFHPELTGRENIFLNGAILGMTKKEIQSKFDEIVDFSGCELYIDTPTKRYSSGMTVRLGFAVAAFLDPEILVVDEVLAVGDAEFQKKAIGKMKEVSAGGGRTVLFVSHNMESISRLCSRSVMLNNGKLFMDDTTSKVIEFYYGLNENNETIINKPVNLEFTISTLLKIDGFRFNSGIINSINTLFQGDELQMAFSVLNQTQTVIDFRCNFELINFEGLGITSFGNEYQNMNIIIPPGKSEIILELGECVIKEGSYTLNVFFQMGDNRGLSLYQKNITTLNIRPGVTQNKNWRRYIYATQHGFVPLDLKNIIINLLN
jgi:lipopolysaccharide transport system ATP-binding protein